MGEDSAPAQRTPARRKARQLARHLRGERPDYAYLKEVFRHLRDELGVEVATTAKKLPYVPTEAEIRPFPASYRETLALHIAAARANGAVFLFESSWKKPYSTRGVRAMLARYARKAGLAHNMPPHRLRHFLFTWLKTQGIDDLIGAETGIR